MRSARRTVLLGIAGLAAPFPLQAQSSRKVGVLSLGSPPAGQLEAFTQELARLGYAEGHNLTVEWRFAEGSSERLASQARELAAMKPDAIFAVSTPAALAAKQATSTIPVVIARVGDPVRSGLVRSMARPEGNITGLASTFTDVIVKLVQLVKDAIPAATQVAFLWNQRNPGAVLGAATVEEAASKAGMRVVRLPVERTEDLAAAFASAQKAGASAVVLSEDLFVTSQKSNLLNLGMRHALPLFAISREFAEAGAVATYGPDVPAMYRRAAQYVDRILKGAKPGDLPVEQPAKYELVVNLRSAGILGLTVPQSLLLRADSVIR